MKTWSKGHVRNISISRKVSTKILLFKHLYSKTSISKVVEIEDAQDIKSKAYIVE